MEQIKEQLMQLTLKIRQRGIMAIAETNNVQPTGLDISLPEFLLLKNISKANSENIFLLDIQNSHCISKSGVSKMLGTLEKKGHILRDVNRNDRRRIVITITAKGCSTLERLDCIIDDYLTEYIAAVGEDYLKQFFTTIDHLYQVNESVWKKIMHRHFETKQTKGE